MPTPTTDSKVTGWLDLVIKSFVGWINKLFLFFGQYSASYAKPLLILAGLLILSYGGFFKSIGKWGGRH